MADTSIPPHSPPTAQSRRGRDRRSGHWRTESDSLQDENAMGGQRRGGGGQRGGRGRGRGGPRPAQSSSNSQPQANGETRVGNPSNRIIGENLTEAASQIQDDLNVQDVKGKEVAPMEEVEGEICFICASTIEHTSIAPCNHQTCHICALRLRALYKTKACAHCRTEADFVIFTDETNKRYEDFVGSDFVKIDDNLGIKFEKDIILDDTILLLRYNCPDKDCEVQCLSWPDLHRHVRSKHGKIMCDLCTKNKKVFTHEHELFTYGELRRHERFGDDNPGAVDQSGFKGHPECGFCRQRFYGDDELYSHCREKHERCHICDRRNQGRNPQYYLNYQELEKHFQEVHFVCLDAECMANKTNVFESEMDLKAHQLSEHPNGLSKDARRDARLVDLSGFAIRTPYEPSRRGAREPRGAGRGRDPNSEPLPMSSAQPMGRAELAYQRQMAIQSAQSVAPRTFGGQLSQPTPTARPQHSAQQSAQPQTRINPPTPTLETLSLAEPPTSQPSNLTPQEQARAIRHASVTERANKLLRNDQSRLSSFRSLVSSYRSSTVSAIDLVDAFVGDVFSDVPPAELGKLVRELADLYENEEKGKSLLEAWNSWKSINDSEDYPGLPAPVGGHTHSTLLPGSGRRVLKLKSSTAQSGRSAVSRQGSWGNPLAGPASNPGGKTNPFPPLGNAANGQSKSSSTTAAWGAASSTFPSSSTVSKTVIPSSKRHANPRPPATMGARANEDMFPSLPAAKKPDVLMAGLTRGTVRWDDRRSGSSTPVTNAWGAGSGSPTPAQAASSASVTDTVTGAGQQLLGAESAAAAAAGKKKAKKGKGQVLYHFG